MSGSASKQTRRDIRRAFGSEAVATVAALDLRLKMAEAQIEALRLALNTALKGLDALTYKPPPRVEFGWREDESDPKPDG